MESLTVHPHHVRADSTLRTLRALGAHCLGTSPDSQHGPSDHSHSFTLFCKLSPHLPACLPAHCIGSWVSGFLPAACLRSPPLGPATPSLHMPRASSLPWLPPPASRQPPGASMSAPFVTRMCNDPICTSGPTGEVQHRNLRGGGTIYLSEPPFCCTTHHRLQTLSWDPPNTHTASMSSHPCTTDSYLLPTHSLVTRH